MNCFQSTLARSFVALRPSRVLPSILAAVVLLAAWRRPAASEFMWRHSGADRACGRDLDCEHLFRRPERGSTELWRNIVQHSGCDRLRVGQYGQDHGRFSGRRRRDGDSHRSRSADGRGELHGAGTQSPSRGRSNDSRRYRRTRKFAHVCPIRLLSGSRPRCVDVHCVDTGCRDRRAVDLHQHPDRVRNGRGHGVYDGHGQRSRRADGHAAVRRDCRATETPFSRRFSFRFKFELLDRPTGQGRGGSGSARTYQHRREPGEYRVATRPICRMGRLPPRWVIPKRMDGRLC